METTASMRQLMEEVAPRLQGTIWKRNVGFLRPWRSRPAWVTSDGFLHYKKKADSAKTKEIDLVKSTISQTIQHANGYYFFNVQSGPSNFSLGFPDSQYEATLWLESMLEVADENAGGRRTWVANLRRMLSLPLEERPKLVPAMGGRDWSNEWKFCLRSLTDTKESASARQRRVKRLYTMWLQFHLFAELLAEMYFPAILVRDANGYPVGLDVLPDLDNGHFSVVSSASTTSISTMSASIVGMPSPFIKPIDQQPDVDLMKFDTMRIEFGSKSWQGHKRLGNEVNRLARFRALVELFLVEKHKIEDNMMAGFPSFPLVAAFSIHGIRVVATAEPLGDRSEVVAMDKRDLTSLSQALKATKMLRHFPFQELPELWLRKLPGSKDTTLVRVSSRYDDVLQQSLRSNLVQGVLIRAGVANFSVESLSALDVKELVQNKTAYWIPYLNLFYYQLDEESKAENATATSFLPKSTLSIDAASVVMGDVMIVVNPESDKLSLNLKEGFVSKQLLDIQPLVHRLQELKKNNSMYHVVSSDITKASHRRVIADEYENGVKKLLRRHIKQFSEHLVTLGDILPSSLKSHKYVNYSGQHQAQSMLPRANTDSSLSRGDPEIRNRPAIRRRRSSLAAAAHVQTPSDNGTYVIDTLHLRRVMREGGVNMRFLPFVFSCLDSTHQQGVQILVASEIIARIAKNFFRYQVLNGESTAIKSRKTSLIRFIDSIMHGLFHDDLPTNHCPIRECVGNQFWKVNGPILYALGPHSSSFALDTDMIVGKKSFDKYRMLLKVNPGILFSALLHTFEVHLSKSILPQLNENRFLSVPFLRNEKDMVFNYEQDPTLALSIHRGLLWSNLQFFRAQFRETDPGFTMHPSMSSTNSNSKFMQSEVGTWMYYYDSLAERFRNDLRLLQSFGLEKAIRSWRDTHMVRDRLLRALRAASTNASELANVKMYCDDARDFMLESRTLFPVEFKLALSCLEMLSSGDEISPASTNWGEIVAWLQFFYRPANQSQFTKCSSSHPIFPVLYLSHEEHTATQRAVPSLRSHFQKKQIRETWLDIIATVDAYCRRVVAAGGDPVAAAATRAAALGFEGRQRRTTSSSTGSLNSMSSSDNGDASDARTSSDSDSSVHIPQTFGMQVDSATSREDIIWFVECFLIPSTSNASWLIPGDVLDANSKLGKMITSVSVRNAMTVPGLAVVWGKPTGLSLDEESQLATVKELASRSRPTVKDIAKISMLKIPSAMRRVVRVSCGYRHSALITDDRHLYTFGYGECGRLGHGNEDSYPTPTAVSYFTSLIGAEGIEVGGVAQVSCGREHTMVVLTNGDLYGFGWAEAGRLGTGDTGSCMYPIRVLTLKDVSNVACGREHTLALNKRGQVFAFGAGFGGRLGNGSEDDVEFPVQVSGLDNFVIMCIDAGECHSAAVTEHGDVFTWGFGSSGALGNGTRENSLVPTLVSGPWENDSGNGTSSSRITSIACGSYHTLAATNTGKLYGWGDAAAGQLGVKYVSTDNMMVLTPQEIYLPTRPLIRDIACGTFMSAVCTQDGRLFQWGSPAAGNGAPLDLEDAAVEQIQVLSEFSFLQIACGAYHTVALTQKLEYC